MPHASLITPSQLAEILGFSPKSIYVLSRRPGSTTLPPSFHVGRALRWHPSIVQKWLDEKAGLSSPVSPSALTEKSGGGK